jgi:nicotinamidase-related amidase
MKNISRRTLLASSLGVAAGAFSGRPAAAAGPLRLSLRSRVEAFRGSGLWHEVRIDKTFSARETAVILCDVWDTHGCIGAVERLNAMVVRMAPFVEDVRAHGMQIIHAPSDTMGFYKDTPQRRRMIEAPHVAPLMNLPELPEPPLPIDDSDGGCDTARATGQRWSREHPAIRIAPEDGVSDNGVEVYNFLQQRGIKTLFLMGVHTNICVLKRTFAIRQMSRWGVPCILIRDMTDSLYDPKDPPYVSHDQGTELVIQHIEKYWCPSVLSTEVLQGMRPAT